MFESALCAEEGGARAYLASNTPQRIMRYVRAELAWERELREGPAFSEGADLCEFRTAKGRTYTVSFTDRIVKSSRNGEPRWWRIPSEEEIGKVPTVVLGKPYQFPFWDSSGEICTYFTGTVAELL